MSSGRDPGRPAAAADPTGAATLELFRENDAYTDFLWRRLEAMAPRPCGGRVLEIGCGIGNLSRLILRSAAVHLLHGIDIDPSYLERMRAEIADARLVLSVGRAEEFCPDDRRGPAAGFDFVVASNVLEHIEDDGRALENFRTMLRPRGVVLILVPAHRFLYTNLDRHLSHFRRYRRRDLQERALAAGLRVTRARLFNPVAAVGWWLNGALLRRKILPGRQLSLYSRFGIPISAWVDRWNPFPFGVSLLAALEARE